MLYVLLLDTVAWYYIFSEVCIPTLILLLTKIINICQNRTVIEVEKYDVDKVL